MVLLTVCPVLHAPFKMVHFVQMVFPQVIDDHKKYAALQLPHDLASDPLFFFFIARFYFFHTSSNKCPVFAVQLRVWNAIDHAEQGLYFTVQFLEVPILRVRAFLRVFVNDRFEGRGRLVEHFIFMFRP